LGKKKTTWVVITKKKGGSFCSEKARRRGQSEGSACGREVRKISWGGGGCYTYRAKRQNRERGKRKRHMGDLEPYRWRRRAFVKSGANNKNTEWFKFERKLQGSGKRGGDNAFSTNSRRKKNQPLATALRQKLLQDAVLKKEGKGGNQFFFEG